MSSSRHPGTLFASTTLPVCGSTPPGTPTAIPRKFPRPLSLRMSLAIPSRICAITPRGPASECTCSRASSRIVPSTLASTKRTWLAPMSIAIPQPADSGVSSFARKLNSRPELRLLLIRPLLLNRFNRPYKGRARRRSCQVEIRFCRAKESQTSRRCSVSKGQKLTPKNKKGARRNPRITLCVLSGHSPRPLRLSFPRTLGSKRSFRRSLFEPCLPPKRHADTRDAEIYSRVYCASPLSHKSLKESVLKESLLNPSALKESLFQESLFEESFFERRTP